MPTMLRRCRALFILPLAILSTAASAITIHIESKGIAPDYADLGGGEFLLTADHETFDAQTTDPASPAFTDASFALVWLGGVPDGSLLAFRDGIDFNAPNQLNVELGLDTNTTSGSIWTFGGDWHFNSGQGEYSGWSSKTSVGRWSFVWNQSSQTSRLVFDGNLLDRVQTVPEPAPLAAFGIAAVALLRRKRR